MLLNIAITKKGNADILNNYKIAFFCSQKCPADLILKSYDYAIKLRDEGKCVISGFHTRIEKDVLHYLLKGTQPVIISPARNVEEYRIPKEQKAAFESERILYVSPFDKKIKRPTSELCLERNEFVMEQADEVFTAYAKPGGNLEKSIKKFIGTGKPFYTFDNPENANLIKIGAAQL